MPEGGRVPNGRGDKIKINPSGTDNLGQKSPSLPMAKRENHPGIDSHASDVSFDVLFQLYVLNAITREGVTYSQSLLSHTIKVLQCHVPKLCQNASNDEYQSCIAKGSSVVR